MFSKFERIQFYFRKYYFVSNRILIASPPLHVRAVVPVAPPGSGLPGCTIQRRRAPGLVVGAVLVGGGGGAGRYPLVVHFVLPLVVVAVVGWPRTAARWRGSPSALGGGRSRQSRARTEGHAQPEVIRAI